jgi:hypothetical protein
VKVQSPKPNAQCPMPGAQNPCPQIPGPEAVAARAVSPGSPGNPFASRRRLAFTLIEVMIAGGILFMCLFAILALVSFGLRNARALQGTKADPRGSIASQLFFELTHTNSLDEGSGSGEFEDYRYEWVLTQLETNGLCEVDIAVAPSSRRQAGVTTLQMVLYLPQMPQRPGGGAPPPRR